MNIDFNRCLTVVKTQLQEKWKPATAMLGVAIIVAAVFGKVAVVVFGLILFGSCVVFCPGIKVMTYLDIKGFLLIGALVGNGFLGILNPALLNYYAAACLCIREWKLWKTHVDLSSNQRTLKELNDRMQEAERDWAQKVSALEVQFRDLLPEAEKTASANRELVNRVAAVQNPFDKSLREFEQRLNCLQQVVQSVFDNKVLLERCKTAQKARADLEETQKKHIAVQKECEKVTLELRALNQQLSMSVKGLSEQEKLKTQYLKDLTDVISRLTQT